MCVTKNLENVYSKEVHENATWGELSDYVGENVRKTSVVYNYKGQNPMHAVSGKLQENWRMLRLK